MSQVNNNVTLFTPDHDDHSERGVRGIIRLPVRQLPPVTSLGSQHARSQGESSLSITDDNSGGHRIAS